MGEILVRFLITMVLIFSLVPSAFAGYRELFEREFLSKPWSYDRMEGSACVECHTSDSMPADLQKVPVEWKSSWHYQNDISCHDCHGGDHEDASMSMSHDRGFVGSPEYADIPDFCGKCHIGILKNYLESGHGKALKTTGEGPNCVTCHGAHNIQRASIDIIYGRRCTQCHSYERAREIKEALFVTEKRMNDIEKELGRLSEAGVVADEEKTSLFRTQAEFRTLFHTIDVNLVKESTGRFTRSLDIIEAKIAENFKELVFREKFSTFLMLIFLVMGGVISFLSKTYKD